MKILCNGCSYTAKVSPHRTERHTWPMFLEKELPNAEIINFGSNAAGNRYIKETTIEYCEKYQVDAVIVMWSGLGRVDVNISDEEFELCCNQTNAKTRYVGYKEQNYRNWFFSIHYSSFVDDYVINYSCDCGECDFLWSLYQKTLQRTTG